MLICSKASFRLFEILYWQISIIGVCDTILLRIYAKNFLSSSNMITRTACPMKIMGYPAFDDFLYLYNENRYAKIIGEKIQELNRCTTHCCWQQQWAKYGKQTTTQYRQCLRYTQLYYTKIRVVLQYSFVYEAFFVLPDNVCAFQI